MRDKGPAKFIIGFLVIGGALTYFIYTAMQSSWAYYIRVDDYDIKKPFTRTQVLRIAGVVGKDSVTRDLQNIQLGFNLVGKKVSLPVSYKGVAPENFAEDREVVVEGRLDSNGVFQADKLMTRCESKYQAKLDASVKSSK